MDSISSLFRINLVTVSSSTAPDSVLKNYDLITDFQVTFRDLSTNQAHQIKQVRLRINNLDEVQTRPEPAQVLKQLHTVVSDEIQKYQTASIIELIDTPWYERWKDTFLHYHHLYSHDFIGANFGVIVMISLTDLSAFDDIVSDLLSSVRESIQPKMMTSYIEHFVVVDNVTEIPENSSEIPQSYRKLYERFLNCFGAERCSWLALPPGQPPHHYIVRMFQNFIIRNLIPWCEHQVRSLNDSISARKGLGLNIFNATRQLLNIGASTHMGQSVVYTPNAIELQFRKLGDIAMCLGIYNLAATNYERARREFFKDGAWFHYAGACEAYAAAQFMQNKFHKGSRECIEKAVATYMDSCRSIDLATRATILATDILRKISPVEAAKFYISLTGDDSDLRSALFLEQASRCFALCTTRNRKAAFHYVLAGYRYSRCELIPLSLRCYSEFKAHDWSAAADHVCASIDRIQKQLGASNKCPPDLPEIALLRYSTRATIDFSINLVTPTAVPTNDSDLTLGERDFYAGEMIKICLCVKPLAQPAILASDFSTQKQPKMPPATNTSINHLADDTGTVSDDLCQQVKQKISIESDQLIPDKISLYSNADIWSDNGLVSLLKGERKCISLTNPAGVNYYQIRLPRVICKHVMYFKLDYLGSYDTMREVVKTVTLNIRPCMQFISIIGPVISIKNVISDSVLTTALICHNNLELCELWHNSERSIDMVKCASRPSSDNTNISDQSFIDIPPNMVAHLLIKQDHNKCILSSSSNNKPTMNNSCSGDDQPTVRWRVDEYHQSDSTAIKSRHGVLVFD